MYMHIFLFHIKGNSYTIYNCNFKTISELVTTSLLFILYTLIDRCLVQSAVSNLFSHQWRCLKLYLPLPVCLICRCVFWLVIMFSDLLFCVLIDVCICNFFYIFFWIVSCFAILGHHSFGYQWLSLYEKKKKLMFLKLSSFMFHSLC